MCDGCLRFLSLSEETGSSVCHKTHLILILLTYGYSQRNASANTHMAKQACIQVEQHTENVNAHTYTDIQANKQQFFKRAIIIISMCNCAFMHNLCNIYTHACISYITIHKNID